MREALKNPPKLAPDTLRVIPLGGLGDVGRNMASFEVNGEILMVDCGVLFPDETHPGVDLILPGLHLVNDRLDAMVALVLTHGHEDHIGAVPYLLKRRPDIPVLGSQLTLALIEAKRQGLPAYFVGDFNSSKWTAPSNGPYDAMKAAGYEREFKLTVHESRLEQPLLEKSHYLT